MAGRLIERSTDFEIIKIQPLLIENVEPEYLKVYRKY